MYNATATVTGPYRDGFPIPSPGPLLRDKLESLNNQYKTAALSAAPLAPGRHIIESGPGAGSLRVGPAARLALQVPLSLSLARGAGWPGSAGPSQSQVTVSLSHDHRGPRASLTGWTQKP
jgi:hypothetical protein